jgi:hypothetical protein
MWKLIGWAVSKSANTTFLNTTKGSLAKKISLKVNARSARSRAFSGEPEALALFFESLWLSRYGLVNDSRAIIN